MRDHQVSVCVSLCPSPRALHVHLVKLVRLNTPYLRPQPQSSFPEPMSSDLKEKKRTPSGDALWGTFAFLLGVAFDVLRAVLILLKTPTCVYITFRIMNKFL